MGCLPSFIIFSVVVVFILYAIGAFNYGIENTGSYLKDFIGKDKSAPYLEKDVAVVDEAQTPETPPSTSISCLMAISLCAQPIGQLLFGQLFEQFNSTPWIVVLVSITLGCGIALYSRRCFGNIQDFETQRGVEEG